MRRNSNSAIWIIATLCAVIVLTALGIVTKRLVSQSHTKIINETTAYKKERTRLAMWRLDTLMATLLRAEDERSIHEFANPELQNLSAGRSGNINPLYYSKPDFRQLYWSIIAISESSPESETDFKIVSPQVYTSDYLEKYETDSSINTTHLSKMIQFENLISPSLVNNSLHRSVAKISSDPPNPEQTNNLTRLDDFSFKNKASSQQEIIGFANAPGLQDRLSSADRNSRSKAVARVNATKKTTKGSISQPIQSAEEHHLSPFQPIWIDEELMLVRKVMTVDGVVLQGIWLDFDKLSSLLLTEIADLFPDASLKATLQNPPLVLGQSDTKFEPTSMVKFPLMLIPNEPIVDRITATGYFHGPIGLAWLATFIAILAGGFMLRNVLIMSERRASFVSSVTHELRTPLTTFRLYSDLLANGMVTDPTKQKSYLNTLKLESERLTHLVENVLSYSRIERGSAKAKVETTSLLDLAERMKPRLSERAQEENMHIAVDLSDELAQQLVTVDVTAVEQIIFNLVDNATKYACGQEFPDVITLRIKADKKNFTIGVCDDGPGIAKSEVKRLFRPFHKSAKQAADSKPGVGLGLALSRRLARAMNGNLTTNHRSDRNCLGACFELSLPLK